jgi:signal transduction histidine kinase
VTVTDTGRRRLSLRVRLLLVSTVALAFGLAIGVFALTALLRFGLVRAADDAVEKAADGVAALVDEGRLPDPIPSGATTVIQVIDGQGRVLAASAGTDRLVAALRPAEVTAALDGPQTVSGASFGVIGPMRVVARPAGPSTAPRFIIAGVPSGDIDDAVRIARTALIAGYAVLLAALAAVAWRLIGATLRPVEALRSGAEKITGTGSADTLPVPSSADEIRRLAVTLNGMLGRIESSRRRQRAFVADAAHELRSPLASLRTQLDVAMVTGTEPDTADLLAEVDRLTSLVDDLLILARADDAAPPETGIVDLAAIAGEVVSRYPDARVPVTLVPSDEIRVEANTGALARVLGNVIDNAVRHASSAVTVSLRPTRDGVMLEVGDDGPGIPEADRARVFERFTRLHDARDRDTGGSGLGLAIVAELLRQQGGSVRLADARPGANPPGLLVSILLPASPPDPRPHPAPQQAPAHREQLPPNVSQRSRRSGTTPG